MPRGLPPITAEHWPIIPPLAALAIAPPPGSSGSIVTAATFKRIPLKI